ncbi:hypothetical protein KC222_22270 [Cedecea davisae]|uniref:Uncharacterized protein n=1 Tax=Cedecea davisae TaxID=158484 RepID=A0ABS6DNA5_9ENTR|nr:hypothetical protein [Cedecea davisae]MBU4684724.1 hypothetical protein [Cedecea davisae]MBU4688402.1 hypothetical protein [Cedecea davisae]
MSLETSLELNNKLLTQHNALLERLIGALASGATIQTAATAQVQEYRETKAESTVIKQVTLDDLEFSDVIALAAFNAGEIEITPEMMQRVIAYRDAEGESRVVMIDALDSALLGVKRAAEVHKLVLLELAGAVLSFWDELPTIADRRTFAEAWLDAKPGEERIAARPKKTAGNKSEERTGPFYCKSVDGSAASELHTLRKLNAMLEKGHVEINRVEYLQLQEEFARKDAVNNGQGQDTKTDDTPDFAALRKQAEGLILQLAKGGYRAEAVGILNKFNAQKLGQVADSDLTKLIILAEKELEA